MGLAQRLCDFQVHRVDAGFDIHDEQQHVAIGNRLLDLSTNRSIEGIGRSRHQSAGIDEPEAAAVPLCGREVSIARHARLRIHDRLAPADDPVEQRRLPDVRPADDRDRRYAHFRSPPERWNDGMLERLSIPSFRLSIIPSSRASAKS